MRALFTFGSFPNHTLNQGYCGPEIRVCLWIGEAATRLMCAFTTALVLLKYHLTYAQVATSLAGNYRGSQQITPTVCNL